MSKPVFWIIGGTTEGRELASLLSDFEVEVYVTSATEYGGSLVKSSPTVCVRANRLDKNEMITFINEIKPNLVIDTSHPYADIVTKNAYEACRETSTPYIRLNRSNSEISEFIYAKNHNEAAEILKNTEGNIFLTCGSKEIEAFTLLDKYEDRIFARVLPMASVMDKCEKLKFKSSNICYMQGPFSKELNKAIFKNSEARYLVTKDSGDIGGFKEKVEAALELGMGIVVIGRPLEIEGLSFDQIVEKISMEFAIERKIEKTDNPYFPIYISMSGRKVKVFGGGKIAKRRISTLLEFGAEVDVFAPEIDEDIIALKGNIKLHFRKYKNNDYEGAYIVIAATNDNKVNEEIGRECQKNNILVSVANNKQLCSFFFPGIVRKGNLVIGITSSGENHAQVKSLVNYLKKHLNVE